MHAQRSHFMVWNRARDIKVAENLSHVGLGEAE